VLNKIVTHIVIYCKGYRNKFNAKNGVKTVEMNGIDLYEVAEGKIVQVWLFSEDQTGEDEFWK
jgi:hypothetical protein